MTSKQAREVMCEALVIYGAALLTASKQQSLVWSARIEAMRILIADSEAYEDEHALPMDGSVTYGAIDLRGAEFKGGR